MPMNPLPKLTPPLFVFVLCLVLSSCEDRGATPESSGKITADKASDHAGPVGTWKIDSDATLAANQAQDSRLLQTLPKARRAEARKQLEDLYSGLEGTLEFKPDNSFASTTVFGGKEMAMRGTWEINGNTITVRAEGPKGVEVTTGAIQGGVLKLTSGDADCVVLRRE